MSEIFISADIEADGRVPGINSMISLGSVAFRVGASGYEQISTFEANLLELEGAVQDEEVMAWWQKFPDAWERCRLNAQPPEDVMRRYLAWIKSLPGPAGLVAYPGSFDFMFIYWYLYALTRQRPFTAAALCVKTYAMSMLKHPSWLKFERKLIPEKYLSAHPHDHTPLNDSIEQAQIFAALYYDNVIGR
ncbi:exonuclease [Candidatus Falkowbacteria bacterium]|nr:exonuclease [Candidatus Falkowbacteria bacterium]